MAKLIEIACTCGKLFKVPIWRCGQKGKCTTCHQSVFIPLRGSSIGNLTSQTKQVTIHTLAVPRKRGIGRVLVILFALPIMIIAGAIVTIVVHPVVLVDVPLEKIKSQTPEKLYAFLEQKKTEGKYQKILPQMQELRNRLNSLKQDFSKLQNKEKSDEKLQQHIVENQKTISEAEKLFAIEDKAQIVLVYKDISGIVQTLEKEHLKLNIIVERKAILPGKWYLSLSPVMKDTYALMNRTNQFKKELQKVIDSINRIQILKQMTLDLDWLWVEKSVDKDALINWLKKHEGTQSLIHFIAADGIELNIDREISVLGKENKNFSSALSQNKFSKKSFLEIRKIVFLIQNQYENQQKKIIRAMKLLENYSERK